MDGFYRVERGGLRAPRLIPLAQIDKVTDIKSIASIPAPDPHTRGLVSAGFNYAGDAALSGAAITPGMMLAAGLIGVGIEGIFGSLASAVKKTEDEAKAMEAHRKKTFAVGRELPLSCGGDEAWCEKLLLGERYGNQQLRLALGLEDGDVKQTAIVQVDAVAEDLMPDRMLAEAMNRLVRLHLQP